MGFAKIALIYAFLLIFDTKNTYIIAILDFKIENSNDIFIYNKIKANLFEVLEEIRGVKCGYRRFISDISITQIGLDTVFQKFSSR